MKWNVFKEEKPKGNHSAYFISGHSWFGIGIWKSELGWIRAFIGEWPHGDDGDFFDEGSSYNEFLNDGVLYWKEIISYPT